ncbi:hypothetical protein [Kitasatospora brasiliensis]|uniref:hypothetical protein n=1 Tax=Kitasatospora brasiliensis TaxID=3058040 RepID=UPI002930FBCB|nr:hypothetical protein [Kitasatospora sp. K002]
MARKRTPTPPSRPPYRPQPGELVLDTTTGQPVVFMATYNNHAYLRPLGGGLEHTVRPAQVEPLPGEPQIVVDLTDRPRDTTPLPANTA